MRDPEGVAGHDTSPESEGLPASLSEQQLVTRIRAGDESAFRTLYLAQYPHLVTFLTGLLGGKSAAEDVVQELFADLWRQRETWQPAQVTPYLFRAARHRAIDALRRERREVRHAQSALQQAALWHAEERQGIAEATETHDLERALTQAITALPKRRRMALALRVVQGMSYAEIGAVLEISEKAAFILVARAREALQPVRDRFLQEEV